MDDNPFSVFHGRKGFVSWKREGISTLVRIMQCLNPVTFFSCWRHLPAIATLQLHPARHARQKPLIPISNNVDQRCVCVNVECVVFVICEAKYCCFLFRAFRGRMWLTCFDISWKWLSRLISIYLLSLSFAAVASDYPAPSTFPCEDISNYYSPVKRLRLRGEALKTQLNTIIAPHHSLSYREVIHWFEL